MSQCYTSRLLVEGVDRGDSGKYVVRAENERGMDMVTVQLLVQGEGSHVLQLSVYLSCLHCSDSLSMASVIGVPHHCGDHHHFLQSTQIVLQR